MKIYSDHLDKATILHAFQTLKNESFIGPSVFIDTDKLETHKGHNHKHVTELQCGSTESASWTFPGLVDEPLYSYSEKAVKNASRRRVRNFSSDSYLRYSMSWHEHGMLIAYLFKLDPKARIGMYDDRHVFADMTDGSNENRFYVDYHCEKNARVFDFVEYLERFL